ncbi:MAG: hypothetical protein ACJ8FU_13325 [Xanthobacteraceae bacterium]|jgi:hypothetical protein
MQSPSFLAPFLAGDSPKRLLQGIVAGAILTMILGFNWGGWKLGSTAKEMAQKSAQTAVIEVLAPICVDRFQRAAEAPANFVELKKVSSWQQDTFIEKGGWATFPGMTSPDRGVAQACANLLAAAAKQ